jgi:hypothetical protein
MSDAHGGSNVTCETPEPRKSSEADAPGTVAGNRSYRCYFIDVDDRIQSYEQIECADDAQAVLKAQKLLAASRFPSAELWQGSRIVGTWGNTGAAPSHRQTNGS